MWKRILVAVCLALPIFSGCSSAPDVWKDARPDQKRVLASFPPLYSLASAIAGDDAYVLCLLTTQGPHEYHFSNTDAFYFRKAELIISNGLELDNTFVSKLQRSSGNMLAPHLRVGSRLPSELLREGGCDCVKHEGHDHDHHHGTNDPHIWLGPNQLDHIAASITEHLVELMPAKKSEVERRANDLRAEIKKIHAEGKAALAAKKNRKILTMHDSLGYFAEAFGVEVVGTIQTTPGQDPNAADMSRLVKLCQDKQVAAIAVEPQYSKTQAQNLQKQLKSQGVNVVLVEFDPLETAPASNGINPDPANFLRRYRENIDALVKALP